MDAIVDKAGDTVHSFVREMTMHDTHHRPLIWVLKGLRHGDTAQAMALALQIGGRVEGKQLGFNRLHVLPNWLVGAGVGHLTVEARNLLRPPWPDAVVATGRRTARVALWIKRQSGGHTKLIHIGRPRMDLNAFDLVVTTPQYGLPVGGPVIEIALPFAIPQSVAADELQHFAALWHDLPRPWILGVLGGGKFPVRLNNSDLAKFGQLLSAKAKSLGGSVILLDSPRSPAGALQTVVENTSVPLWQGVRGEGPNPYQAALKLCDHLAVTSDSVSMVSEMLHTEKPVWIFKLAQSALAFSWRAEEGLLADLARRGILHPPRNVDKFIRMLMEKNQVGDLSLPDQPLSGPALTSDHAVVLERIKRLLQISETSGTRSLD
jgi:uncharacterized protein